MQIALIGTGNVGQSLAKSFAKLGYNVVFGARDPESPKTRQALAAVPGATVLSVEQASAKSDLIVVAARPEGTAEIAKAVGPLGHRILVDAMNAMAPLPWPTSTHGFVEALGDQRVVKAWNTIGAEIMAAPKAGSSVADLLISGADAGAKKVVGDLALSMGFGQVLDLGGPEAFALQQEAAKLWIHLAIRRGVGRNLRIQYHPA